MNLIIMILLISMLILVHEAGHFVAAKMFNIKVDKFGFGLPFGPTLFSKKIGETEFLIHAFLLGGYVAFPDDDENSELPKNSPERFANKPIYQRAIVVVAGVFSNFLFAIFLVAIAGIIWGSLPSNTYETSILKILPTATRSTVASGLKQKDVIYKVNGSKADLPIVFSKYLAYSKSFDGIGQKSLYEKKKNELLALNKGLDLKTVIPVGKTIKLPVFEEEKAINFTYDEIIGFERVKDNPEDIELSELQNQLRDKITDKTKFKIIGNPVTLDDFAKSMSDTYKPVTLTVLRDGKEVVLPKIYPDSKGMIGIEKQVKENLLSTKNPISLAKHTYKYVYYNTALMTYGLGKIFTGKIPMQEMHGIVAITKIGSDVIEYQGLFKGLLLTAIISLNLAMINLLPIPALDGGHLFFLLVEKLRGKPLNEKAMEVVGNVFFYLLIILMVLIIFNDVFALATKQI